MTELTGGLTVNRVPVGTLVRVLGGSASGTTYNHMLGNVYEVVGEGTNRYIFHYYGDGGSNRYSLVYARYEIVDIFKPKVGDKVQLSELGRQTYHDYPDNPHNAVGFCIEAYQGTYRVAWGPNNTLTNSYWDGQIQVVPHQSNQVVTTARPTRKLSKFAQFQRKVDALVHQTTEPRKRLNQGNEEVFDNSRRRECNIQTLEEQVLPSERTTSNTQGIDPLGLYSYARPLFNYSLYQRRPGNTPSERQEGVQAVDGHLRRDAESILAYTRAVEQLYRWSLPDGGSSPDTLSGQEPVGREQQGRASGSDF